MKAPYTLQRGLKKRHISMIALGGIIGSSYFLGTGIIFEAVGPMAFLAYIGGGIITYLTMACLAELTVSAPVSGSFITYSKKYISRTWACGIGWSYWVCWVVYIPAECLAGGILMNNFDPAVHPYIWALLFALLITIINLVQVHAFGESEFWLALIKIVLLVGFSILGLLIFFGWIGNTKEFLGTKILTGEGGLFPKGLLPFLIFQVVLLANFQGSEIIGLSAAESHHPEVSIPASLKKISLRIVGLYIIPVFILSLIYPWNRASASTSIFSDALALYGLKQVATIFTFFIISGAISCANSGLYATARSLYILSTKRMAPKWLKMLSRHGVPARATLVTLGAIWFMLLISFFFQATSFYTYLLALSGFTGSMCWISICIAQWRFRKQIRKQHLERKLAYKMPLFPFLTWLCIVLQIGCLFVIAATDELRGVLYIGIPILLLPMVWYYYDHKRKYT